jgi:tRNA-splicing ligase RtcB
MQINTMKPYKIFAEHIEQEALNQFESAMQQDFVVKGALMPDAHMGEI